MDSQDPQLLGADDERRQSRRVRLVTQVQCEALERNEVMITRDISMGGMFINGQFPLPMDSEMSLTFRLRPTEPAITCRARVMFSRVGLGMGIKFLDLSAEAHQTLQNFVQEAN